MSDLGDKSHFDGAGHICAAPLSVYMNSAHTCSNEWHSFASERGRPSVCEGPFNDNLPGIPLPGPIWQGHHPCRPWADLYGQTDQLAGLSAHTSGALTHEYANHGSVLQSRIMKGLKEKWKEKLKLPYIQRFDDGYNIGILFSQERKLLCLWCHLAPCMSNNNLLSLFCGN